jgi:hypothetical protein
MNATWRDFESEAPEMAAAVAGRFTAVRHHVLATLRADGSPRVSGTEVFFRGPDLMMGSMYGAVKARDLQRDGRCAIHANPGAGQMEDGDAKLSGVAVEIPPDSEELRAWIGDDHPPEPAHLFRVEPRDVVFTTLHPDGDRLVIEAWRPGHGVTRVERA